MKDDLEAALRRALRPEAPSEGFTERVMARIAAQTAAVRLPVPPLRRAAGWGSAALAASIVIALGLHQHALESRERDRGLEARRELLEALRLTDGKIELAHRALQRVGTGAPPGDGGSVP